MIGTAIASLTSGIIAGLLVAISTAVLGSTFTSEAYLLYGVANCVGAIVWAVLPRMGLPALGSELFNPTLDGGYARKFKSVVALGTAAGMMTAIFSTIVRWSLSLSHDISEPDARTATAGSQVGLNHDVVAASVIQATEQFQSQIIYWSVLFLDSMVFNVFDKILSTVTAAVIIYSIGTLPNYVSQRTLVQPHLFGAAGYVDNVSDFNKLNPFLGRRRWILLAISIYIIIIVFSMFVKSNFNFISFVPVIFLALILCVSTFFDPFTLKSIDRHRYGDIGDQADLFFDYPENTQMKFQRDVFEDVLKLTVIALALVNAILSLNYDFSEWSNYQQVATVVAANAFIITAFRYIVVFFMRFAGRM
jgi:hypothetical protein